MVSAELSHNPYLKKAEAKFNKNKPRVNSAICKYQRKPFVDWVDEVPRIFRDEMNGYDFDLYFKGTDSDYERVCKAFRNQNVSEDEVRIIRKGSFQDATTKYNKIRELLEWLKNNPNNMFSYDAFLGSNTELSDTKFPLILLHGTAVGNPSPQVVLEPVDDIVELVESDLSRTPILIFISAATAKQVSSDLKQLLEMDGITSNQLFFKIDSLLNKRQVVRVLSDRGIANPQVVEGVSDVSIQRYIEDYSLGDYIRNAIGILRTEASRISAKLEEASKTSKKAHSDTASKVKEIDREIARLKTAEKSILELSVPDDAGDYSEDIREFFNAIGKWKRRRQKIEGEAEALIAASEYEGLVRKQLASLTADMEAITSGICDDIAEAVSSIFSQAEIDERYAPDKVRLTVDRSYTLFGFCDELLKVKETKTVEQRSVSFGFFSSVDIDQTESTKVEIYSMSRWCEKARSICVPIANSLVKNHRQALGEYQKAVSEQCQAHIASLISEKEAAKEAIKAKFNSKQQAIQRDADWLAMFEEKLTEIEEG